MAHIERPQAHPWSVAKNERGACAHANCEAPMTATEYHASIPGVGIAHVHYCAEHAALIAEPVRGVAIAKVTAPVVVGLNQAQTFARVEPIGHCPSCGVADWDGQPCMRCGRHPAPKR
ncbi:MAG: hypothetical protein ACRENL_02830 [Candidatus Dormibacteria bacterium]